MKKSFINLPKNIPINWNNTHELLDYSFEEFKDSSKVSQWQQSGLDLEKLKIGLHQLKQPYEWMNCVSNVIDSLPILNPTYCIHLLTPGNFLPFHSDLYSYYSKKNNISNLNDIIRIIIFLNDAVPGQILQIADKVYINYKKGDVAYWFGSTPHLAANLSTSNRYTLQITATVLKT